ncbi:MAG: cytidine deaminase [Chlorobi bacterium]|nr:cytidine deaminase [Chlorobiota bacterium]
MEYRKLIKSAREAQKKSFSPFSNFKVGAALMTKEGKIFTGTNIECASYSLTMCAERNAVFQAYFAGEREFKAIAVACDTEEHCSPCGACRQALAELCGEDLEVIMLNINDEPKIMTMKELLPMAFTKEALK